ncbi:MAG: hypothetical protein BRD47_02135 [Bacteroidetes bacterium QS_8_68_28]|nr:MAG: hypothetical protein BRD47_02135 [Bacteroidetes bacterium QS_8_68_28]
MQASAFGVLLKSPPLLVCFSASASGTEQRTLPGSPGAYGVVLGGLLVLTGVLTWRPAWHPGMIAAAFTAGGALAWTWRRGGLSAGQVVVLAFVLRMLFVAIPPGTLSDDGARYVWDGVVQVEEGISPYRYAPEAAALADLRSAPMYERLNSASYHSVYPPASQLVFAAGALFYDALGWRGSFYVINALFALMEGALVVLLWRRGVGAGALLLYALHPLVLLEMAGQGHTEAGAALGLVGAVVAARAGHGRVASLALAGATLFKLYPLVLVPFLGRRFGRRALWPGALAGALLSVPYMFLYAGGVAWGLVWDSLGLYVQRFEFNAGPYYALKELAYLATGADWSKILGPALRWVFLAGLPVLYVLDARRQWPLGKAFFWTLALYLLCATTVHPWYLVPLLAVAAVRERPAWPWQGLGLCAVGTYAFYAPVPYAGEGYGTFVVLGWGGLAVGGAWHFRRALLCPLLRRRARRKARRVTDLLPAGFLSGNPPARVLDLGAGEGFVGEWLHQRYGAEVVLADVGDFNRTDLPQVVYDGCQLPFEDDAFDAVVLYFVLHHAEDPEAVLREAMRVAEGRVVVAESVYKGRVQRRLLRLLDRGANRLRCGKAVADGPLRFRRAEAWRALIERLGGTVAQERRRGRGVHPQALFVVTGGAE